MPLECHSNVTECHLNVTWMSLEQTNKQINRQINKQTNSSDTQVTFNFHWTVTRMSLECQLVAQRGVLLSRPHLCHAKDLSDTQVTFEWQSSDRTVTRMSLVTVLPLDCHLTVTWVSLEFVCLFFICLFVCLFVQVTLQWHSSDSPVVTWLSLGCHSVTLTH